MRTHPQILRKSPNILVPDSYRTTTAATVTWATNNPSNSQILWGLTTSYNASTNLDTTFTQNHKQFLIGLTPSTTYHFQVRSTDSSGNLVTGPDQTFTTPPTAPAVPDEFKNCAGDHGTGAKCTLNPGTYVVNNTIDVARYAVTVEGGASDRKLTRLVRGSSLLDPMIRVIVTDNTKTTLTMSQAGASQGIVVQNLTFCGGGNTHPNDTAEGSPAAMSGAGEPCGDQHYTGLTNCNYTNQCTDISVDSAAVELNAVSPQYPTNPFANTGPYALQLNNVDMEDSAGQAIRLYATADTLGAPAKRVNDIWIRNSAIHYSAITGILYGANSVRYDDRYCDEYAVPKKPYSFKDDPALFAPRNIRIENNDFSFNNTGAMGGGAVRWVGLRNNIFFVNYIMPQAGNFGGGGIQFGSCADKVEISYNTITGPNWSTGIPPWNYDPFKQTSGLELSGRNINIHHNTFRGHGETAIGGWSLFYDPDSSDSISNNHVLKDNGWSKSSDQFINGGIELGNSYPFPVCAPAPRETSGVTVSANNSEPIDVNNGNGLLTTGDPSQAFGVLLQDHGSLSTGRLHSVKVEIDNFQGLYPLFHLSDAVFLDYFVGLHKYSGLGYSNALPPVVAPPRALPVSVISAASSVSDPNIPPLWPTPPLCPDLKDSNGSFILGPLPKDTSMGSQRAKFKFSASDAGDASSLNGANNIGVIWGIFSVGGQDSNGAGGPSTVTTAPDQGICQFAYDAGSNLIHIANGSGVYLAQSPVGTGGQDISTPGGCVIHGAASTSSINPTNPQATPVEYVLDLVLDVTLPATPNKYHIYSYTQSRDYNWDGCNPNSFCPSWKYSGYWWNTMTTP